jgi:hypothetical protein
MTPNVPEVTALDFFRAIWGTTPGWAELTCISKSGVRSYAFHSPESLDSMAKAAPGHNRAANVYMGVCLRKEKWPRPTGKTDSQGRPVFEFRGTEANAQSSWCVWSEFDFTGDGHKGKTIPEAQARKALKEFPFAPSIIVKSGGGIQVYWLLKEPAEGKDLWRVKAINRALALFFGADPQSVDLARILRVPGTLNLKYNPPRPCVITWWKADKRYILDDFEGLLPTEPVHDLFAPSGDASVKNGPIAGSPQSEGTGPRKTPSIELPEEAVAEISIALSDLWKQGYRHLAALHVAGMFAWNEVVENSARAVVAAASASVGGDTEGRLKDVKDTYRNFMMGRKVTGLTSFKKMIEDPNYPIKDLARHFLETCRRVILRFKKGRTSEAPKAENTTPPQETIPLEQLPIPDSAKKIIRDGLPAYVDFRKANDPPAKFKEREEAGKMGRSEADCYVITLLLQAGVRDDIIHDLYRNPINKIGEKSRETGAEAEKYINTAIEACKKGITSQPKWQATSIAGGAANKLDKDYEDEHFRVKLVEKYLQEPPTYDVILILDGIEYFVQKCSLDQVYYYDAFTKVFFSKFNKHLPTQKQTTWVKMYDAAKYEEIAVEKEEGTLAGQIETVLNALSEMAVGEKSADISINHGAVRTPTGLILFKTPIVLRMLREKGSEAKRQEVLHHLKSMGWKNGPQRLGRRVDWVWSKAASNGHGPSNGTTAPVQPPEAPMTPPPTPPTAPPESQTKTQAEEGGRGDMLFEMETPNAG